jgi:hypothetical protein
LVCKECYQGHAIKGHKVIDTSAAANEVSLRKKALESYRLTMEEQLIGKCMLKLENVVEEFKECIIGEAIKGKNKFYEEVEVLLNYLDAEASFAEHESELNTIENYKESNDPMEVLGMNDLEAKLRAKRNKVSKIAQSIKELEEETNDCEHKSKNIRNYKNYSKIILRKLQLKKIEELKQFDEMIVEKTHELIELFNKND